MLREFDSWIQAVAMRAIKIFPANVIDAKKDDAIQESRMAFLKCYRKYLQRNLDADDVDIRCFSYARVRGAAIDFVRERSERDILFTSDEMVPPTPDFTKTEDLRIDFENITRELPEWQRALLRLLFFEGYTLKEIGNFCGKSEGRICQIKLEVLETIRRRYEA